MQDSSGSTTFRCLETCGDSWDSAAIKNFAATSGTIIVNEVPDRGPSMIKLKHARAAEFATCQNILYDEDGSCAAHLLHNALVKQTREDDIVGHAHAVHYVISLEGRRRQLLGGLKHLVSQDFNPNIACTWIANRAPYWSSTNNCSLRSAPTYLSRRPRPWGGPLSQGRRSPKQ